MKNNALEFEEMHVISRGQEKIAKDGRKFFTAVINPGFGLKRISRNFWTQYKKDSLGMPTAEQVWERVSPEQCDLQISLNKPFVAARVTAKVEEFTIGDRKVNQYTTLVFKDENVLNVFASANHPIVDETTGELQYGTRQPKARLGTDSSKQLNSDLAEAALTEANAIEGEK